MLINIYLWIYLLIVGIPLACGLGMMRIVGKSTHQIIANALLQYWTLCSLVLSAAIAAAWIVF